MSRSIIGKSPLPEKEDTGSPQALKGKMMVKQNKALIILIFFIFFST
jgi:hypothetical protein